MLGKIAETQPYAKRVNVRRAPGLVTYVDEGPHHGMQANGPDPCAERRLWGCCGAAFGIG
jgi:hypothetical protein